MERRKFVIGLGSLAAGGAAATGTGAFTSAEIDRTVSVDVDSDADAYVGLKPADTANGDAYARVGGDTGSSPDNPSPDAGEVKVDFNGISNNTDQSLGSGTGVNANAEYVFEDVLTVTNQGSQEVSISLTGSGDIEGLSSGTSFDPDVQEIEARVDPDAADTNIGVGQTLNLDFAVETDDSTDQNFGGTLTIEADST
jgi:hypothetical protein